MRKVEIRRAPALTVAGIAYRGPYAEIGVAFGRLHEVLTNRALYRDGEYNVAIYFDDATATPAAECRALAGRSMAADAKIEPPLERVDLMAGEHAVLRHVGPYADIGRAYAWLLGVWLPGSGRAAANLPCYEIYVNTPMDVEPKSLITDIYVPLE